MTDGVPLRLQIEPGTFRVTWHFPLRDGTVAERPGEVKLKADSPPEGNVFKDADVDWVTDETGSRSAGFPQSRSIPTMSGALLNGLEVTLVDVEILVWAPDRASLTARAALVGRYSIADPQMAITGLQLQVMGLDAAAGIGPVNEVTIPSGSRDRRYLDGAWTASGDPDSTQQWEDEEVSLELRFLNAVTVGDPFFFRVAFSPILTIDFRAPVTLNQLFVEWVEPVRRIIALATGRAERITYVAVRYDMRGALSSHLQVFGTALHQAPFASRGRDVQRLERAFFLAPDEASLLQLLRTWQHLLVKHHPSLETYGEMMFVRQQHPRSRLLLLMQAIEGWYGFEKRESIEDSQNAFTLQRSALLESVEGQIKPEQLRFLRRYLQKRLQGGLEQALRAAVQEAPIDVTSRLQDSQLVRKLMGATPAPQGLFDALRAVRNDLSHGTRGFDLSDLNVVADLLDGVVRAHLLKILGLPHVSQERAQIRQ